MKLLFRYGYCGIDYQGFSMEEGRRTVEGAVLEALTSIGAVDPASPPRHASRTDRGVSALGNAFCFTSLHGNDRAGETLRGFNASAAADGIAVVGHSEVADGFSPRHATGRTYVYWLFPEDLRGASDPDSTRRGTDELSGHLSLFEGEHDFTAFSRRDPTREVESVRKVDVCRAMPADELMEFLGAGTADTGGSSGAPFCAGIVVRSGAFLWNQVRRMVASALDCLCGRLEPDAIVRALAGGGRGGENGGAWGSLAAPEPLVLWDVTYEPGVRWRSGDQPGERDERHHASWLAKVRRSQLRSDLLWRLSAERSGTQ
jgi:tRNA pseudouridine38-40 synthase